MFKLNFSSKIIQEDEVFLRAGKDVMVISPLGGAYGVSTDSFRTGDHDFLFKFFINCTSIMHYFRNNDASLQTEKDVMATRRELMMNFGSCAIHFLLSLFLACLKHAINDKIS